MSRQKTPYAKLKPKEINDAMWREIVSAWENGLSDREAAFRACRDTGGFISEAQLKTYVAEDEEIGALRDFLLNQIVSQAKINIAESINNGSVNTAKWYLERKAADEFSSKAAVAFEGAVASISIEEKKEQMDAFLEQFDKTDNSVLEIGKFPEEIEVSSDE